MMMMIVVVALLMVAPWVSAFSTIISAPSKHYYLKVHRSQQYYRYHNNQHQQLCFASPKTTDASSSSEQPQEEATTNQQQAATTTATTTTTASSILDEANDALVNVGWASPREIDEGEMTSDDPFVKEIDAGIQRDFGVGLDELLNPAKVVNLERDLYNLRLELASVTGVAKDDNQQAMITTTTATELCDGGGGGDAADAIRSKIAKREKDLLIERRSVFRGWLKNVFLVQAILSLGLSFVMATRPELLFGQFGWFSETYNMDISIQVLGYWWWWLFVVPSLRSRRPTGPEKKALDIAFLATPLVSLLAPVVTRDTGIIWAANFAVVAASYAFAFTVGDGDDDGDESNKPEWLKFAFKSLDFGSGRERGARS